MKTLQTIFCLACLLMSSSLLSLDYFHSYSLFHSMEAGDYIETYLKIPGNNLKTVSAGGGKYKSVVNVSITFKKEGEIVQFDKYSLSSPELESAESVFQMVDLKRYSLSPGLYYMELLLSDANDPDNKANYKERFTIEEFDEEIIKVSPIVLLEKISDSVEENMFTKNGMDMVPYVYPYYPNNFTELNFYAEIYNTNYLLHDQDYLLKYMLVDLSNDKPVENMAGFLKQSSAEINTVMAKMDMSELESGNYSLLIEVRNKLNDLLAQSEITIMRNNKRKSEQLANLHLVDLSESFAEELTTEEVEYYLASVVPLAGQDEERYIENMIAMGDDEVMRKFLFNFFVTRSEYFPERLFEEHKFAVKFVENKYATPISPGFETSRGYAFIRHGKPSFVNRSELDAGTFPYEIWYYDVMDNGEHNVQFVFLGRDAAANDYELIHTSYSEGLKNPNWRERISRGPGNNILDFDAPAARNGNLQNNGDLNNNLGNGVDDF